MKETRKQIFLIKNTDADKAFEIKETPIPDLKTDEVLIKVKNSGLNFADVMARKGLYREAPPLPCVLGYEVSGTVIKSPNDKTLEGKNVLAFTRFNGYSSHLNVGKDALVEIEGLDFNSSTALATQYVTAWYASNYITALHPGEKVLIHAAAGGVGSALVQIAKNVGCEVFALVGSDHKKDLLKELKADHIINYKNSDYVTEINNILKGSKLNVSFNPVAGSTYKKDVKMLGAGGRIILFGGSERNNGKWGIFSTLNFVRKMGLLLPIGLMMTSRSILGVNMLKVADHYPDIIQQGLQWSVRQVREGYLRPIHNKSFHYKDIAEAQKWLESGQSTGKVSIFWE